MNYIFDGKEFARKIEEEVKARVNQNNRKLKLVSIYDPNNIGSRVYTNIKAKKAEELGILFDKFQITKSNFQTISKYIETANDDDTVNGIMVQTPLENQQELIDLIDPRKDVDGMRDDSPFLPATVRAVLSILETALKTSNSKNQFPNKNIVVIGNRGEVGKRLTKKLQAIGMDKEDFDVEKIKAADAVISCTGQAGLIKADMIKEGTICIDVGYPQGDFDPGAALKAGFFTPVPGGVGPVTVAMLFANLAGIG